MTDVEINPLGPPLTKIQVGTARVLAPDYTNSAKLAADQAFAGRVSQCLVSQARLLLERARDAGFSPPDIAMAIEIATAASSGFPTTINVRVTAAVSLMASDPAVTQSYTYGPAGNQQSAITDATILGRVQYYWHPLAVGYPG